MTFRKGHILEIGCGESSIYFSQLAEKHNRFCYHVEYSKSGVENMKNTKGYFGSMSKIFNMKSDEFFEKNIYRIKYHWLLLMVIIHMNK
jgi:precorrin-6B methylase 2